MRLALRCSFPFLPIEIDDAWYTPMAYNHPIVIIETSVFTRCIGELLNDDEYAELQAALVERPEAGDRISGGHGLRKLRWKIEGGGKRGGVRVIYYWLSADDQLWMLYAYAKAKREDLTRQQIKQLAQIVKGWKDG